MTKNFKEIEKVLRNVMYMQKIIQFSKFPMAYNIGVANIARTCKEQLYGVHPLWA